MIQKITPFLWFDTNCEEAMNFYVDIFKNAPNATGDSKIVSIKRYPEGPLEGPMKGMEGKVLTAVFELNGQEFLALDGGPVFKPTAAMSLYVECQGQEEIDYFWSHFTESGDPNMQQCGWVQDKFGFSWQIIPHQLPELLNNPDKEKAGRALAAMMQMKKIDISQLEKAVQKTA